METNHLGGYVTMAQLMNDLPRFGLKLSRSTIVRWAKRREVPMFKFGQTWTVPAWVLTELLRDYSGDKRSNRQGTGK